MDLQLMNILLADDDTDDCFFFVKAIKEIPIETVITTVDDGEKLMDYLSEHSTQLPDILFLDINMPRKTGFECLAEMKLDGKLKNIPIVMFSTSYPRDVNYERDMISLLYNMGADHFIRKHGDFEQLKKSIQDALTKVREKN